MNATRSDVLPRGDSLTRPRDAAVPAMLDQLLREIAALASGGDSEARLLDPADFDRWDGGGVSYLETRLEGADLPDIDLSAQDGQVTIRIAWPSQDDDSDDADPGRG